MKLLSFGKNARSNVGIRLDGGVLDIPESFFVKYGERPPDYFYDMRAFLENYQVAVGYVYEILKDESSQVVLPENSVRLLAPLKPRKIFCVAVNYREHAQEAGGASVEEPYVFIKFSDNIVGPFEEILLPKASRQLDHEVELAVVIGRKGKYIRREEAFEYVVGYSVFNDISFRDRRIHPSKRYNINWLHGKNMDRSAAFGPYIVTKEEVTDPHNLQMTLRVNGEVRQDGNTRDMIHKIPELIEYVSDGITLMPGDVIATGTVSGTGLATGKFLQSGDVIEATIEKIGTLVNRVVAEQ